MSNEKSTNTFYFKNTQNVCLYTEINFSFHTDKLFLPFFQIEP